MASKKLNFMSSDGVAFEVEEIVALQWLIIEKMLELVVPDGAIPLPGVTGEILSKVIEYCKKHVESSNSEDKSAADYLKSWDAEFLKIQEATLFDLVRVRFFPIIFVFSF